MYKLLGFNTHNSYKVLYVLEALGLQYDFRIINITGGENRQPDILQANPHGRVPILYDNDYTLFESGAICRYLAAKVDSSLYPSDTKLRAQIDQWLDTFSCHLGNYIAVLFFEKIIKKMAGLGGPNEALINELEKRAHFEFKTLDRWLAHHDFLAGGELSIADFFAFAYVEQTKAIQFDIGRFESVGDWLVKIQDNTAIGEGRTRMNQALKAFKDSAKN